jgi:hypothetical protein
MTITNSNTLIYKLLSMYQLLFSKCKIALELDIRPKHKPTNRDAASPIVKHGGLMDVIILIPEVCHWCELVIRSLVQPLTGLTCLRNFFPLVFGIE